MASSSLNSLNEGAADFVGGERAFVLGVGHCRLQHGENVGKADALARAIASHRLDAAFIEHYRFCHAVHLGHIGSATHQKAMPTAVGIRQTHLQFYLQAEILERHVRRHNHLCLIAICLVGKLYTYFIFSLFSVDAISY